MGRTQIRAALGRLEEATRSERERLRRLAAMGDEGAAADVERHERRGGLAGRDKPLQRALQRVGLDGMRVGKQRIDRLREFFTLEGTSMASASIRPGLGGAVELGIEYDRPREQSGSIPSKPGSVRLRLGFNRIIERSASSASRFRFSPRQSVDKGVLASLRRLGWRPGPRNDFRWDRKLPYGTLEEVAVAVRQAVKDVMQALPSPSRMQESTPRCERGLPCLATCLIEGRPCIDLKKSKRVLVKRYKAGPQRLGWSYMGLDPRKHKLTKVYNGYSIGKCRGMVTLVRDGRQWRIEHVAYSKRGHVTTKWLPGKYKTRKEAFDEALNYDWSAWNDTLKGISNWSNQAKKSRS